MASYRLYFLDGAGHIQTARELEAPSDEAALEQCETLTHGEIVELWNLGRLVRRLGPACEAAKNLNM
jgi:hypothetical protein